VTSTLICVETVTEPTDPVACNPVTETTAEAATVTVPTAPVAATPVTRTEAAPVTVTEPTAPVASPMVTAPLPKGSSPHPAERFQPSKATIASATDHHAMRMMALVASAVGKTTVKSPFDAVLSEPKSRITTEGFV